MLVGIIYHLPTKLKIKNKKDYAAKAPLCKQRVRGALNLSK